MVPVRPRQLSVKKRFLYYGGICIEEIALKVWSLCDQVNSLLIRGFRIMEVSKTKRPSGTVSGT